MQVAMATIIVTTISVELETRPSAEPTAAAVVAVADLEGDADAPSSRERRDTV